MFAATPSLRSGGGNLERVLPAHIHPMPDGSLHAALPPEVAQEAIRKGWAEQHPVARTGYIPQNVVMIYAPRDAQEIEIVARLVDEAYRYASGAHPSLP
jgi:hypothetical protein